jgi:hypothetical protein
MDPREPTHCPKDHMSLAMAMLLVASSAVGFSVILDDVRRLGPGPSSFPFVGPTDAFLLKSLVFILGGVSLAGPPILLLGQTRRPWGAGCTFWFLHGLLSGLLWIPILYSAFAFGKNLDETLSGFCYVYGTPPFTLCLALALWAGSRPGSFRRRLRHPLWQERFGLLLGLTWSIVGGYFLFLFYRNEFLNR